MVAYPVTRAAAGKFGRPKRIQALTPKRCYLIVRKFCGEGYAMAEAVMQVTPCHPSNVKYRMIEALEGLDDALDRLRVRRDGDGS